VSVLLNTSSKHYKKPMWAFFGNILLCAGLMQVASAATESGSLQVRAESTTREADYTIGSIATQHITLHVPQGFELDPGSLPAPAQNEAIELRNAHWTTTDANDERLIRLDIDWQIFVAGDTVKTMPLKKLHLEFKRDQQRLTVDIPPDKVIVSSLLPARIDDAHVKLYPDVAMPEWSLSSQLWQMAGWLSLALCSLFYLAWYIGWIRLPQEKHMPFRQAWRALRKLHGSQHDDAMQAMRLLSRAMDQFAGYAVTAENLPQVLLLKSDLHPYQEKLTDFYQDIQQVFFAGKPASSTLGDLKQLARQLSHLEIS
jgi:hypothetical protein